MARKTDLSVICLPIQKHSFTVKTIAAVQKATQHFIAKPKAYNFITKPKAYNFIAK